MANGSTRDVKLTLSVESLGQENVGKLEQALRDLAATGGKSSAEFADLADQIARLGQQNGALQSFKALSTQAEELAQRQQAVVAAAQAEGLGGRARGGLDGPRFGGHGVQGLPGNR